MLNPVYACPVSVFSQESVPEVVVWLVGLKLSLFSLSLCPIGLVFPSSIRHSFCHQLRSAISFDSLVNRPEFEMGFMNLKSIARANLLTVALAGRCGECCKSDLEAFSF
jgi:hypothetical protein